MTTSVFVLAPVSDGLYAVTTRPREPGRIGLPGGKVDAGETLRAAAIREAREEGFEISGLAPRPFYQTTVEGGMVYWFEAQSAAPLDSFMESHRLQTGSASLEDVAQSGYKNDEAVSVFLDGSCNLCAAIGGYCGNC